MKTIFVIIFASFCFLLGCKKTSPPQYTIKGRVLNGTTMQVYANQQITATVHTYNIPQTYAQLGSCSTDAQGNFSLTYTQTSIDYDRATIDLQSQFFALQGLAVNQNIDSNFYLSSRGSLRISMQTSTPLELNNDTLFLGYENYVNNNQVFSIDTFVKTFQGYYKTIRVPTPYINVFWGRGINNYVYNPAKNGFIKVEHSVQVNITGDPYVDSVTINY
jgi:hypothetical protein